MNTDEFINKAKKVHGNKYDYSKTNYILSRLKVEIICPEHGSFWQTPNNHLSGKGCPKCAGKIKPTKEQFVKKAREIHGDKYDYSKVNYINAKTKIEIVCPKHGSFWQTPDSHINKKYGCPICGLNYMKVEDFINKAKQIHGNKYDYSDTYLTHNNNRLFANIACPKHGIFLQRVDQHLFGKGCPKCSSSKGEVYIQALLEKNNIEFETQKTFDGLVGVNNGLLRFDFYLPNYNTLIEYNGKQHYNLIDFFGGEKTLEEIQYSDKLKYDWCKKNGVELIIIDKCPHEAFCSKDRRIIEEMIQKIIDKNFKKE